VVRDVAHIFFGGWIDERRVLPNDTLRGRVRLEIDEASVTSPIRQQGAVYTASGTQKPIGMATFYLK
jgi:hypothetical protein